MSINTLKKFWNEPTTFRTFHDYKQASPEFSFLKTLPPHCYVVGESAQKIFFKQEVETYDVGIDWPERDSLVLRFEEVWEQLCEIHKPDFVIETVEKKTICCGPLTINVLKRTFKDINQMIKFHNHSPFHVIVSGDGKISCDGQFLFYASRKAYWFNTKSIIVPKRDETVLTNLPDGEYKSDLYKRVVVSGGEMCYFEPVEIDDVSGFMDENMDLVIQYLRNTGLPGAFDPIAKGARKRSLLQEFQKRDYSRLTLVNGKLDLENTDEEGERKAIDYITQKGMIKATYDHEFELIN